MDQVLDSDKSLEIPCNNSVCEYEMMAHNIIQSIEL